MDLAKVFMKNLIRYRTERGLSQKDLADRTGISPRMIAHYEKHVSKPSLDKISAIAEALEVTVFQMLSISEISRSEDDFITSTDPRTLKQFKKILRLSPGDRSTVYKLVDALLDNGKE